MKFLQVIFIVLIIYYSLRLIGRLVMPWLLKRFMNSIIKRQAETFAQNQYAQQQSTNGKVTVNSNSKASKNRSNEGEYVDFEEVK
jgi:hypothetical protein